MQHSASFVVVHLPWRRHSIPPLARTPIHVMLSCQVLASGWLTCLLDMYLAAAKAIVTTAAQSMLLCTKVASACRQPERVLLWSTRTGICNGCEQVCCGHSVLGRAGGGRTAGEWISCPPVVCPRDSSHERPSFVFQYCAITNHKPRRRVIMPKCC